MSVLRMIGMALLILEIARFLPVCMLRTLWWDRAHHVLYSNYTANTMMCLYGGIAVRDRETINI